AVTKKTNASVISLSPLPPPIKRIPLLAKPQYAGTIVLFGRANPTFRVDSRRQSLLTNDPAITAGSCNPAGKALFPALAGDMHPIALTLKEATFLQKLRCAANERLCECIQMHATVSIDIPAFRGNSERRIGDDEIETEAGNSIESVAFDEFNVRDSIQGGAEAG